MRRAFTTLIMAAGLLSAQQLGPTNFTATTGDITLTASSTTATIQTAATNPEQIHMNEAMVFCSVACSVSQSQNGQAATATQGTIIALIPGPFNPFQTTFWTPSNVGGGTTVGGIIHVPAGGTILIDLSAIHFGNGGTNQNYSVTVGSITGVANITFFGTRS